MEIDSEFIKNAARSHVSFEHYVWFVHGWKLRPHQVRWAAALQLLEEGRLRDPDIVCERCGDLRACSKEHSTNKLLMLAPPGSGKTMLMVEWVCWKIGKMTVLGQVPLGGYVSYSDDVASLRSMAVRNVIEFNEIYKAVFPTAIPAKGSGWGQNEWFLWRKDTSILFPTLRASGFEGGILSYRWPSFIVIDDPHSIADLTLGSKNTTYRLYGDAVRTRGVLGETPMVMICTRHADDDLAGRVMKMEGGWAKMWTPALTEEEESYWPVEVINGMPMGVSTEELLKLKARDSRTFLTQYQALPPSTEGDLFKWWTFHAVPHPSEVERVYHAWDTAQTEKAQRRGSYSAGIEMLLLKDHRVYISWVYREKKDPVALGQDMASMFEAAIETWGMTPLVLVENKSSGPALVDFLRAYSTIGPRIMVVDIEKGKAGGHDLRDRAAAVSYIFEARSVLLPVDWTPWKDEYIQELSGYPSVQYLDQVAATVLGLQYIFPSQRAEVPNVTFSIPGWTR